MRASLSRSTRIPTTFGRQPRRPGSRPVMPASSLGEPQAAGCRLPLRSSVKGGQADGLRREDPGAGRSCTRIDTWRVGANAGHQLEGRGCRSRSCDPSWLHDWGDAAPSLGTGQDRRSEIRIETGTPRRARHRGQQSRVRKGARRWILRPQLGQCIYDIRSPRQGRARGSGGALLREPGRFGWVTAAPACAMATQSALHAHRSPERSSWLLRVVLSRCRIPGPVRCPDADVGVRTPTACPEPTWSCADLFP